MDPLRYLAETDGYFTRAMAREVGYHDKHVTQMVRARIWRRIRRGYYTFQDIWAAQTPEQRHLARAHAVVHSLGDGVALSGVSGLLEHGVATWGMSLDRVHVTRLDGAAGRTEGDVVHHEGFVEDDDIVMVGGRRVLRAPRCAIEAGTQAGPEASLVAFDSLLHLGLCNHDELVAQHRLMSFWPRTRRLHIVVLMADGRAESPGESRGRWLFWSSGLPAPQLQFEVHDRDGKLVGVCDWAWPAHKQLGEFDGYLKFGRLLKPGQVPGDVAFAEKRREDILREVTGFGMVRLIWADLDRPRVTRARMERVMHRAG